MNSLSKELNDYINKSAKAGGAVLVGYTKIRRAEPVIIYGFPYPDMWFFKRPYTLTKWLGEVYSVSRDVQNIVSSELKKNGYTAHDKTIFSVYGDFRPLVVSSGIGEWGHNGLVVNSQYGSRVLYAATFTNAPLEMPALQHSREDIVCNDCLACIDACPAKAFESGIFNPVRCIAKVAGGCAECLEICRGHNI
jgi:epoxyqueuosine reductase